MGSLDWASIMDALHTLDSELGQVMRLNSLGGLWISAMVWFAVYALEVSILLTFPLTGQGKFTVGFVLAVSSLCGISALAALARLTAACSSTFASDTSIMNEARKCASTVQGNFDVFHYWTFLHAADIKRFGIELGGLVLIDMRTVVVFVLRCLFQVPVFIAALNILAPSLRQQAYEYFRPGSVSASSFELPTLFAWHNATYGESAFGRYGEPCSLNFSMRR